MIYNVKLFLRRSQGFLEFRTGENSQLAALPYVIAGITVLISGAAGLYWLVPAVIFSFIKAIWMHGSC
jgi:hypothetical protein